MANVEQRTKLTLKDIGEPSRVKSSAEKALYLGRLVGVAAKFVERKSADGMEVFEGLAGNFRIVPDDPNFPTLESGVLFIPDAFHNMCAGNLRDAQKTDPAATVTFAFDVAAVKANNPAGYSWSFLPVIENPNAKNPLDDILKALPPPPKGVAALTDGTKAKK